MVPGAPTVRNAPFPEPMVDSSIHISQIPQLRSSPTNRENIWSPPTEAHADRKPTYNGVQPGSPRGGSFMTLLLLPCGMQPSA